MPSIDLNCDMAEVPELAGNGVQDALLALVSSANVACGAHAGNPNLMRQTIQAAQQRGVSIGAHPGYPDPQHFGRMPMEIAEATLRESLIAQLNAVAGIAAECCAGVHFVKPHGALYNQAAQDALLAGVLADAMRRSISGAPVMMLAGASTSAVFLQAGIPVITEAFADRRYEADGSLKNRRFADALLTDPAQAAAQAVSIARDGVAFTASGLPVAVFAGSLCIHSDTPGAVTVARAVRQALEAAGFEIAPATASSGARSSAP